MTTYSPCCWHSPANRIPKGRTEKGETDRPFTVADLTATSGGAPMRYIGVASSIENNRQDKPLPRRGMFPVRFDLTVTSVKELTVEANKLEKRNPIQADGIEG